MDGCCLNIQRLPEVQHGSQLYIFWRTEVWLPAHTFRHMHHNTLAWFFGQWFFQYYVILRTIQYTVRKEMKCSEDSQILHEIVHDTSLICLCFYDFRIVSRTISSSISESPQHFISFLTVIGSCGGFEPAPAFSAFRNTTKRPGINTSSYAYQHRNCTLFNKFLLP